jgi:hypothetical protein
MTNHVHLVFRSVNELKPELLLGDFFEKINYVHNNPVEEGIVFRAEEYLYSSARDYAGIKGNVDNIIIVR